MQSRVFLLIVATLFLTVGFSDNTPVIAAASSSFASGPTTTKPPSGVLGAETLTKTFMTDAAQQVKEAAKTPSQHKKHKGRVHFTFNAAKILGHPVSANRLKTTTATLRNGHGTLSARIKRIYERGESKLRNHGPNDESRTLSLPQFTGTVKLVAHDSAIEFTFPGQEFYRLKLSDDLANVVATIIGAALAAVASVACIGWTSALGTSACIGIGAAVGAFATSVFLQYHSGKITDPKEWGYTVLITVGAFIAAAGVSRAFLLVKKHVPPLTKQFGRWLKNSFKNQIWVRILGFAKAAEKVGGAILKIGKRMHESFKRVRRELNAHTGGNGGNSSHPGSPRAVFSAVGA